MLTSINPSKTEAWKNLTAHAELIKKLHLIELFDTSAQRFKNFSLNFNEIFLFDYSKNLITEDSLKLLISLAKECELPQAINKMFAGEKINQTENRAVLHIALRNRKQKKLILDGSDVVLTINKVLEQMRSFSKKVYAGEWLGYKNNAITDVVNIGIGGSDLGPKMATEALSFYNGTKVRLHFVSNVDGTDIFQTLKKLKPETTLFLIASKTFTTQETMTNAHTARNWFLAEAKDTLHIQKHFAALSTNAIGVAEFGIADENRFEFWDWVGGRYSLCSAVGLGLACAIGFENFEKMLDGFHAMDEHFSTAPFEKNIPVLMALISLWYINFFDANSEAVLAYDQRLKYFVTYLQQCNMESNGKSVDRSGQPLHYQTGPVIWGDIGTNNQHSFFQLIHQGTRFIPCDFLVATQAPHHLIDHQNKLVANCFAQSEALAFGNVKSHDKEKMPFKYFKGNNPSNTILYKKLDPYTLGSLIALYEHKVFVQGVIWNIFSFDQWGVELGKKLANQILVEIEKNNEIKNHDSSTNSLIELYKKMRN